MRSTPEDNLAFPVLINLNNGSSGSGFLLNTGSKVYLITAKHVLFANNNLRGTSATLIYQTKDINDDTTTNIQIDLNVLRLAGQVFLHQTKDVCALPLEL